MSVSRPRVPRSGSRRGRGVIIGPNEPVSFPPGPHGRQAVRVGRTQRSSTRSRNRLCSTCCARPASLTLGSRRCTRRCSTRASTTARRRQCTGSCGITASRGATPATSTPGTIPGRESWRPHRTWCGCGISAGSPAPAGVWFYLYTIWDLWSRETVGWCVDTTETAAVAERLIAVTARREGVDRHQLIIHSDSGAQMTSGTLTDLYDTLGIRRSLSRPRVSNDNPEGVNSVLPIFWLGVGWCYRSRIAGGLIQTRVGWWGGWGGPLGNRSGWAW